MKTMLLLQKLSNLLLILLCLVSADLLAETKWEVAVIFKDAERTSLEDQQFQKDVDLNILELSRITPNAFLKVGVFRESTSKMNLARFLKSFYKEPTSKKALIVYSHGEGPNGLRDLSTREFKELLTNVPHLDLLWLDACFMANLEFLYQLKDESDYTIASQEAEFAGGLPFASLSLLPKQMSGKEAATTLAKNFIESYSYLQNGKQRNYVTVSSATITVANNKNLAVVASDLKWVAARFKNLDEEQKTKLNKLLTRKATMDDKSLVDLGMLLIELRKITTSSADDKKLTTLIRLLNIEAVKKLKTNPRIQIEKPHTDGAALLVYGFNQWSDGDKDDVLEQMVFDSIIKHDNFVPGPNKRDWPYKKISGKSLYVSPFAPGINTFNYYFLDNISGKLLSSTQSVSRTHDVVESFADTSESPIVYTAYTQQVGTRAERYTGLNISMPGSVPSMDYYELEFNQLAEWLSL